MKKCLAVLAVILFSAITSFAQSTTEDFSDPGPSSTVEKPSRDFLMFKFSYNGWMNTPDSIKTKGFGRGVNVSLSYDFPIKKSNFSFAAGIGVGASNIYLDKQRFVFQDTLDQMVVIPDTVKDYKRYKFTTTYVEMPLELRYFSNNANRNKGFKAAIGATIGLLVGAHTKGVTSAGGSKVFEKENTRRFIQQWSFAATARIGWGNYSLYGSYNLTNVFKDNQGPTATPFAIGFCLTGL